jgi:hypothetical protein
MAPPLISRPLYRETVEARQLLADLQEAGCTITVAGDEIAIGNLGKLSDGIWQQLEQAGPEFVTGVKESLSGLGDERASQWRR